jgi:hypothetical protein
MKERLICRCTNRGVAPMTALLAAVWLLLDSLGAYWPSWRLPHCTGGAF